MSTAALFIITKDRNNPHAYQPMNEQIMINTYNRRVFICKKEGSTDTFYNLD